MKKIIFLFFALGFYSSSAQVFRKNQSLVQFGVCFNSSWYDYYEYLQKLSLPPTFTFKYEFGLSNQLGITLSSTYFGFSRYPNLYMSATEFENKFPVSYDYSNQFRYANFSFVPKIQYHHSFRNILDGYVGFGVGLRTAYDEYMKTNVDRITYRQSWLTTELNLGLRLKLNEQLQTVAELGFGPSALSFGLVYCFSRK